MHISELVVFYDSLSYILGCMVAFSVWSRLFAYGNAAKTGFILFIFPQLSILLATFITHSTFPALLISGNFPGICHYLHQVDEQTELIRQIT